MQLKVSNRSQIPLPTPMAVHRNGDEAGIVFASLFHHDVPGRRKQSSFVGCRELRSQCLSLHSKSFCAFWGICLFICFFFDSSFSFWQCWRVGFLWHHMTVLLPSVPILPLTQGALGTEKARRQPQACPRATVAPTYHSTKSKRRKTESRKGAEERGG